VGLCTVDAGRACFVEVCELVLEVVDRGGEAGDGGGVARGEGFDAFTAGKYGTSGRIW
jgi:hypothetical protein